MTASVLRRLVVLLALLAIGCAGGREPEPARQYVLEGQILAVLPDQMSLTIRHEAIPGLMAAMTMTFPVAERRLLEGRAPGETVTATLEVRNAVGRLVSITHTGNAPLPSPSATPAGGAIAPGDPLPDAALVDQTDRRRTLADWNGAPFVLTFVHTRCGDSDPCGRVVRQLAALDRAMAADPDLTGRVQVVAISADPAHDTPAALSSYARGLKVNPARWTFLTGDAVTVQRVAGRLGVTVTAGAPAAPPTVAVRTMVIDPHGRVQAVYPGADWTPAAVLADVKAAQGAR